MKASPWLSLVRQWRLQCYNMSFIGKPAVLLSWPAKVIVKRRNVKVFLDHNYQSFLWNVFTGRPYLTVIFSSSSKLMICAWFSNASDCQKKWITSFLWLKAWLGELALGGWLSGGLWSLNLLVKDGCRTVEGRADRRDRQKGIQLEATSLV